jgi:predicted nucleic acid-binding protein
VLDCSVTAAWFYADERDAYSREVAKFLIAGIAYVPVLWKLELANALVIGERRRRITRDHIEKGLTEIEALDIRESDDDLQPLDLVRLATAWNLSVYDATYVQLAQRMQLPLATLDDAMSAAATAGGVKKFGAHQSSHESR